MLDVFLPVRNDIGNGAYRIVQALKTTGINVEGMRIRKHQFNYPEGLPIGTIPEMRVKCKESKIVWFRNDSKGFFKRLKDYVDGTIIITHPGSNYRRNFDTYNRLYNKYAEKHIAVSTDMMELGAKNTVYNGLKICDTNNIKPKYHKRKIPVIGHFPSDPDKKGTDKIKEVLNELSNSYDFVNGIDLKRVNFEENIKRMQNCDIYIEQLFEKMYGVTVGVLGMQVFESAACGNISVSNLFRPAYYKRRYGKIEVKIANTPKNLYDKLSKLLSMSVKQRTEKQKKARKWIEEKHSLKPMGKEILKDIQEYL